MKFELGLPSVFWLVLILALIPGVQVILEQFFPSTEYWYSALIVAVLGALAKAIQVTYGNGAQPVEPPSGAAGVPAPAPEEPSRLRQWLF